MVHYLFPQSGLQPPSGVWGREGIKPQDEQGKHLAALILLYLWVWGAHYVYIKNKHGDTVEQTAKVTQISQYYRHFELPATSTGVLTGPPSL